MISGPRAPGTDVLDLAALSKTTIFLINFVAIERFLSLGLQMYFLSKVTLSKTIRALNEFVT